jgi:hypothetical protein
MTWNYDDLMSAPASLIDRIIEQINGEESDVDNAE